MREKLVKNDLIECVIGLGPNLFYNASMEACIVICRTYKRPERRGKVLLINAVNEVTRKNAQSFLEDKHIRKIASTYEKYEDVPDFAKVITIKDIEENNYCLSIPLYIKHPIQEGKLDERSVQECYEEWRVLSETAKRSFAKLHTLMIKEIDI